MVLVRIGFLGAHGAGEDWKHSDSENWVRGGHVVPVKIGYFGGPWRR